MRFIDEAKIRVAAGHGGRGCVSFRRETFVPRGGPDGGDGGDGGDVIFRSSSQLGTLQDFRFKRIYTAPNGEPGQGTNKAGRDGENIVIHLPVGTVLKDAETGEVLHDFTESGQEWVACEGGRGGKGNAHFVTSTFQAPKFAQPGEEGGARELVLELKLLADVGLVGFPNAGKSTLISKISAARPKIADYPFTTLVPNLGVVSLGEGAPSFVVADIPGLIEGAHTGAGLGHRFLKHVERTGAFLHLLDGALLLEGHESDDGETGWGAVKKSYSVIRRELELFNPEILKKTELVVLTKADLHPDKDRGELRSELASTLGIPLENAFVISAVSGEGVRDLVGLVANRLGREGSEDAPA